MFSFVDCFLRPLCVYTEFSGWRLEPYWDWTGRFLLNELERYFWVQNQVWHNSAVWSHILNLFAYVVCTQRETWENKMFSPDGEIFRRFFNSFPYFLYKFEFIEVMLAQSKNWVGLGPPPPPHQPRQRCCELLALAMINSGGSKKDTDIISHMLGSQVG